MSCLDEIVILGYDIPSTPLIIFLIEMLIFSGLLFGWYFGARRLNLDLHHYMVYGATGIHSLIFLVYMFPKALNGFSYVLQTGRLLPLLHWGTGLIAVISSLTLATTFLLRRDIPLSVLKKVRPLMIITIISWVIAFSLGFLIFISQIHPEGSGGYYIFFWKLILSTI